MLQRIDILTCEFYALRIYWFRNNDREVQNMTSPGILGVAARFLTIASRIWDSDRRPCYFDRELFLVGLETEDRIHRGWIKDRLNQGQLKNALTLVWQEQDKHQTRMAVGDLKRTLINTFIYE